jgi:hypothetical protein
MVLGLCWGSTSWWECKVEQNCSSSKPWNNKEKQEVTRYHKAPSSACPQWPKGCPPGLPPKAHSTLLGPNFYTWTFFFFGGGGTGVWTQVLTFASQMLYHLRHSASHFLSWVFLRQGLVNYLPRLALNCDPPDLCLLSRYDYRYEPPAPSLYVDFWGTFVIQTAVMGKLFQSLR